jgi:hypothetical protein
VYPVSIPEALSKRGYTPEVVTARIAAELRRIDREATTMMSRQPITENRSEIDFQLPGQFLSFRILVRYTRTLLNIQNTEVNIDITEDKKKYIAQIRVLGGRQSGASKAELSPISADIDAFLAAVGRTTMEVSQPYVLATYQIARCERAPRCDFADPLSLLNKITRGPF